MFGEYNFKALFTGVVAHHVHGKVIGRYNVTQDNAHDTKTFVQQLATFGCNTRKLRERIFSIYYCFVQRYQTNQLNKE